VIIIAANWLTELKQILHNRDVSLLPKCEILTSSVSFPVPFVADILQNFKGSFFGKEFCYTVNSIEDTVISESAKK
jgi:hypothetical protein